MPHKHKRKPDSDVTSHDLPPTSRARPLSIHKKADSIFTSDIERKRKHQARQEKKEQKRDQYREDDTPKAFRRLMAFQEGKRLRSGLDDGNAPSRKKSKLEAASQSASNAPTEASDEVATATASSAQPSTAPPTLKISPHESLSTFSRRVDQSLPLTSLPKHKTKLNTVAGLEKLTTPLTKHNKRLARMQKEWRNTEQKLKDKGEEQDDELADQREEDQLVWLGAGVDPLSGSSHKKRKRGGGRGRDIDDVDPWKVLEKKRREEGALRQRSLLDVVTAPPVLKPLKNIFREKEARSMTSAVMT